MKWRKKRELRREKDLYRRGFEWAMSEFYLDDVSLEMLRFHAAVTSFDPTNFKPAFMKGVEKAMQIIVRNQFNVSHK